MLTLDRTHRTMTRKCIHCDNWDFVDRDPDGASYGTCSLEPARALPGAERLERPDSWQQPIMWEFGRCSHWREKAVD